MLDLVYETHLCSPDRRKLALGALEAFLGVTRGQIAHAAPHLPVKQHAHNVFESVANWRDVAASAAAAPYANAPSGCGAGRRRRLAADADAAAAAARKAFHDHPPAHCREGGPGWLR